MPATDPFTQQSLRHIRYLSETIGGRGSCTPAQQRAAEYAAEQMRFLGLVDVRLEPHRGAASTYQPYALAFAVALLGTLLAWVVPARGAMALAAMLSALSAWGMLVESDFGGSWLRWLLPKARGQNAVGVVPPTAEVRSRVVLSAHLDTHRTPVFYSSPTWHKLFGLLVTGAVLSLVIGAVTYGLGALFGWYWVRWIGLALAVVQILLLGLCIHADLTPFSPGANDDASGVGVILGLAERLREEPMAHTEVWLALTDCEETMAYGMDGFLDAHMAELGENAVYIILDQVGLGRAMFLTADGLLLKRKTHPRALELARQAASALPDLKVGEHVGIAYTDAAVATKRGLIALTVDALPPPDAADAMHWHQMTDTLDHVDPRSLADTHAFTWQVLKEIDRS